MSVTYLKHPVHGCKVATMEQEAVFDESNGWVRFDPYAPVEAVGAPASEAAPVTHMAPLPELEDLQDDYELKFGALPNPGWDIPTLTEKLSRPLDPLDHDHDGRKGGSLPRRRGRPPKSAR